MSKKHHKKVKKKSQKKRNLKTQNQRKNSPEVVSKEEVKVEVVAEEAVKETKDKTLLPLQKLKVDKRSLILVSFLIGVVVVSFFLNNRKPQVEKEQEKVISTTKKEEPSKFESMLLGVIEELSMEKDIQYALDEDYYNEKDVMTYLIVVTGHDADSITSDDIKTYLLTIFIPIEREGVVYLVKKDNKTLVLESWDANMMNRLDYMYMGTANDEIVKRSKGAYICQNDEAFEDVPYGTANVRSSGCGPISLTMAINYLYEKDLVSLTDVLTWAEQNHMYEENSGTRWSMIRNYPKTIGVNCQELYFRNYEAFSTSLGEGQVYVTSMKKGSFTNSGHFIVITEIRDGKAFVLDSTSICRSLKEWDARLIFEESNQYFWKISK